VHIALFFQWWPSNVRRLCDGYSPFTEKNLITNEKEEEMGQINTMKTNSNGERTYDWPLGMNRPGGLRITFKEFRKYKTAVAAIQETR
jgi:hypothetical protein